ncbi:putative RNA binding protein [Besnoitia besnoiti]|uniref:Putative RNA binding protein n=1 Tax=Besnoitia besnoiti TaxID=94643 RepID=A0A2A9MF11_BESBE|nr:putative RNA binding protein [Besnoitia besnoiti]PFH34536.1 putative RNA binding protein [Besnoitia besnoiti]
MLSSAVETPKASSSLPTSPPPGHVVHAAEQAKAATLYLNSASGEGLSNGLSATSCTNSGGLSSFPSTACTSGSRSAELLSTASFVLPPISPTRSRAPAVPVKLFVGRLPLSTTEEMLRALFSQFGPIADLLLIRDRQTSAFKGCAFVRMQSITDADRAIRHLDSAYVLDPALGGLQVKYAVGEAERLGLPGTSGSGAAAGVDQVKLFVGSLPPDIKEDALRDLFERFGRVEEVFLMRDEQPPNGGSLPTSRVGRKSRTGCAFVRFAFKEEALFAIGELNGRFVVPGSQRAMEVRFAENRRSASTAHGVTSHSRSSSAVSNFVTAFACSSPGTSARSSEGCRETAYAGGSAFSSRAGIERLAHMASADTFSCFNLEQDFMTSSGSAEDLAVTAARAAFAERLRAAVAGPTSGRALAAPSDHVDAAGSAAVERGKPEKVSRYGSIEDLFETLEHLSLNDKSAEERLDNGHADNDKPRPDTNDGATAKQTPAEELKCELKCNEQGAGLERDERVVRVNAKHRALGITTGSGIVENQVKIKEEEDIIAVLNAGSGGRTRAPSALDGMNAEIDIASLAARLRRDLSEPSSQESASAPSSAPTSEAAAHAAVAAAPMGATPGLTHSSGIVKSVTAGDSKYEAMRGTGRRASSVSRELPGNPQEQPSGSLYHPGGGASGARVAPSFTPPVTLACEDFLGCLTSFVHGSGRRARADDGDRFSQSANWAAGQLLSSMSTKADSGRPSQDSLLFSHGEDGCDGERLGNLLSGLRARSGTFGVTAFEAIQGSQAHGPPGANVFIFHIPNEWTERDLLMHFSVYGPVVSARIASDRLSGRNRGFGFVSFAHGQAAAAAVTAMNGFQVNGKRLKVQIKKGEEQYAHLLHPLPSYSASNDIPWLSAASTYSGATSAVSDSHKSVPFAVAGSVPRRDEGDDQRPKLSLLDFLTPVAPQDALAAAVPPTTCSNGENGTSAAALFQAAVALRNLSVASVGQSSHGSFPHEDAVAAAALVAAMRQQEHGRQDESLRLTHLLSVGNDAAGAGSLRAASRALHCATEGGPAESTHATPPGAETEAAALSLFPLQPSTVISAPAHAVVAKETEELLNAVSGKRKP